MPCGAGVCACAAQQAMNDQGQNNPNPIPIMAVGPQCLLATCRPIIKQPTSTKSWSRCALQLAAAYDLWRCHRHTHSMCSVTLQPWLHALHALHPSSYPAPSRAERAAIGSFQEAVTCVRPGHQLQTSTLLPYNRRWCVAAELPCHSRCTAWLPPPP